MLLSFEKDPLLATLFQETLDPKILVTKISAYTGKEIEAGRTLLIFDEIQESNAALNALKYFCEEAPEYHVVAAGALLGVKMSQGRSFPVGKVDFLDLFPMTFEEFLDANNGGALRALLEGKRDLVPLADAFHQKFLTHLTNYFIVGGMPEVVAGFAGSGGFAKARHIQETILRGYQNDFAKTCSGVRHSQVVPVMAPLKTSQEMIGEHSLSSQVNSASERDIYRRRMHLSIKSRYTG